MICQAWRVDAQLEIGSASAVWNWVPGCQKKLVQLLAVVDLLSFNGFVHDICGGTPVCVCVCLLVCMCVCAWLCLYVLLHSLVDYDSKSRISIRHGPLKPLRIGEMKTGNTVWSCFAKGSQSVPPLSYDSWTNIIHAPIGNPRCAKNSDKDIPCRRRTSILSALRALIQAGKCYHTMTMIDWLQN